VLNDLSVKGIFGGRVEKILGDSTQGLGVDA